MKERRPSKSASAVIDTGCLLNILSLQYAREVRLPEPRKNNFLRDVSNSLFNNREEFQERYYLFFQRYPKFHTTSHIIAELNRHVTHFLVTERMREEFWDISFQYLQPKNFSEELIEFLNLYESNSMFRRLVPRIGVPDTGLIQLAFDLNADLLTEDRRTLANNVTNQIVNCVVVSEILSVY